MRWVQHRHKYINRHTDKRGGRLFILTAVPRTALLSFLHPLTVGTKQKGKKIQHLEYKGTQTYCSLDTVGRIDMQSLTHVKVNLSY